MPRIDLDVFLEAHTEPIGRLTRVNDGTMGFRYLTNALVHPLSLSPKAGVRNSTSAPPLL